MTESTGLVCSFCGNEHTKQRKFIPGNSAYICDECVLLAAEIIKDEDEQHVYANNTRVGTVQQVDWKNSTIPIIAFYKSKLNEVFKNGVRVSSQQIPLSLHGKLIWFSRFEFSYETPDFVLVYNIEFVEDDTSTSL